MAKPKTEVGEKEYFQNVDLLYEVLSRFRTAAEVRAFFKEMLTSSELRMLKKRWHIACLLKKGGNIRRIASQARASTQTVIKVKKQINEGQGGLRRALDKRKKPLRQLGKIDLEEAPDQLSARHWVFGKAEES